MRRLLIGVLALAVAAMPVLGPTAALAAPPLRSDDLPDRPKGDLPKQNKQSKLRAQDDMPIIDPTVVNFTPQGAPNPAVYGEAITVIPNYDAGPGADGLETLPTCNLAQSVVDAGYAAGTYAAGLVCDGAVAKEGFTIGVTQPVTASLTITPATLTVTASSADSSYGTVPAITPSFSGFQFSDDPSSLTTQPTCTTTATAMSSPGAFTSNCSGAASNNYTFNYVAGVVNIVKAALTITPSSGSATYGSLPTITPNFTGLVNGTGSLTKQPTCGTSVTKTTGAGTFTDTTTCAGAESPNYTISYGPPGTTTITPAALTVTAVGQSRLVGQPNGAFSATFSGFVNGETQSVLQGTLAFTTEATQASGPGSYPLLPSGLSSPNYAISFKPGTIRVTATPPTPTPTPTPSPTVTPTKSPTPTPSPTRTSTGTPTPPPTPSDGWPLWATFLLVAAGVLVLALIVVGGLALARSRRGEHLAE